MSEPMNCQRFSLFRNKAFLNGLWLDANSGKRWAISNPASGQLLGDVPEMGAEETACLIPLASQAQKDWAARTAKERSVLLRRWYVAMMDAQEELAQLLTLEQGKPLAEARGEIAYGAGYVEWYAEEARRVYGETIPGHQADKRLMVIRQPVGVCAAITPWNFPHAMIARKAAAALAAGCAMIVKPAPETPFSALAMAALAEKAGIPAGVFNVVTGSVESSIAIGHELCTHPLVAKLSFTGSTEVGRILMRQCSATVKKLSLELGGNAPFIVFEDADINAALDGAMLSKFRNAGQTCVCANRFFVQSGIHDEFVQGLIQRVEQLKVGNGWEEGVSVGPLINHQALAKVAAHVADAVAGGANVEIGGHPHTLAGTFYSPTVLSGVTPAMRVFREETFGPVAPIVRFDDEKDVVALANATESGLAAYFYTRDVSRVFRVAEQLEYGMVGINTGMISTEIAPFGGIKQSGFGREGGHHGLDDYLQYKYLCLGEIR